MLGGDFRYDYFRQILQAARDNFAPHLMCEAPEILPHTDQTKIILRHDVDICLKKALIFAEMEHEFEMTATYMVNPHSYLYSLTENPSKDIMKKILSMKHEIGLHFDVETDDCQDQDNINSIEARISAAARELEQITGQPVRSVSFHRPLPRFLRGPLTIKGLVNAYSWELMDWYLSDSKGHWREGEPLPRLRNPEKPLLQLLMHPIWWGEVHLSPEMRLQEFFEHETQGKSPDNRKAIDLALTKTLWVRRRNWREDQRK